MAIKTINLKEAVDLQSKMAKIAGKDNSFNNGNEVNNANFELKVFGYIKEGEQLTASELNKLLSGLNTVIRTASQKRQTARRKTEHETRERCIGTAYLGVGWGYHDYPGVNICSNLPQYSIQIALKASGAAVNVTSTSVIGMECFCSRRGPID